MNKKTYFIKDVVPTFVGDISSTQQYGSFYFSAVMYISAAGLCTPAYDSLNIHSIPFAVRNQHATPEYAIEHKYTHTGNRGNRILGCKYRVWLLKQTAAFNHRDK